MTVVKTHERHLHQTRPLPKDGREILHHKRAISCLPNLERRRMCGAQPRRDTRWKVEIRNHHFVARRQLQRGREEVVRLGAAGTKRDLRRLKPQEPRANLAAFFDLRKVSVPAAHAQGFVAQIILHRLVHAERRDAFRSGVKIRHLRKRGELFCSGSVGQHDVRGMMIRGFMRGGRRMRAPWCRDSSKASAARPRQSTA